MAVAITSVALTGCFDSGSSSSDKKDDIVQQVSISGMAVKGLLSNATVTAYTMNDVKLVETTTGADGTYTLPQINHQGAVIIKLTTNANTRTVCDAAPGCGTKDGVAVGFGDDYAFNDPDFILTSVLPSPTRSANQKLMVTPLTHLAAQRVVNQGLTSPSFNWTSISSFKWTSIRALNAEQANNKPQNRLHLSALQLRRPHGRYATYERLEWKAQKRKRRDILHSNGDISKLQ